MTVKLTARQHFWKAHQRNAAIYHTFLEMVQHPTNPLTSLDLTKNIERNPDIWQRFEHWVQILRSKEEG